VTQYTSVTFQREVADPAQAAGGLNLRDQFSQPSYSIVCVDGVVTVTHGGTGVSVDVPFSLVRDAIRAVETAPKAAKKPATAKGSQS
jgi:hypothetical protein